MANADSKRAQSFEEWATEVRAQMPAPQGEVLVWAMLKAIPNSQDEPDEAVSAWLHAPHNSLSGTPPISIIRSGHQDRIWEILLDDKNLLQTLYLLLPPQDAQKCFDLLSQVFSEDDAVRWLNEPNESLRSDSPIHCLMRGEREAVWRELYNHPGLHPIDWLWEDVARLPQGMIGAGVAAGNGRVASWDEFNRSSLQYMLQKMIRDAEACWEGSDRYGLRRTNPRLERVAGTVHSLSSHFLAELNSGTDPFNQPSSLVALTCKYVVMKSLVGSVGGAVDQGVKASNHALESSVAGKEQAMRWGLLQDAVASAYRQFNPEPIGDRFDTGRLAHAIEHVTERVDRAIERDGSASPIPGWTIEQLKKIRRTKDGYICSTRKLREHLRTPGGAQ